MFSHQQVKLYYDLLAGMFCRLDVLTVLLRLGLIDDAKKSFSDRS